MFIYHYKNEFLKLIEASKSTKPTKHQKPHRITEVMGRQTTTAPVLLFENNVQPAVNRQPGLPLGGPVEQVLYQNTTNLENIDI